MPMENDPLVGHTKEVELESRDTALAAAKRVGQVVAQAGPVLNRHLIALHPTDPEQVNLWIDTTLPVNLSHSRITTILITDLVYEGFLRPNGRPRRYRHLYEEPMALREEDVVLCRLPEGDEIKTGPLNKLWLPSDPE